MSCAAITFLQYFKSIELGGLDLGPSISLLLSHALFYTTFGSAGEAEKRQKEKGRGEEGGNKMLGRFLK